MTITCATCGVWVLDDQYKKISAGRWATFDSGIDDAVAGSLWVWGSNNDGQHGLNDCSFGRSSPTQVPADVWTEVDSNGVVASRSAARKIDATLWMWGNNTSGSLGQITDNTPRSSPVQIPGTKWSQISAGADFTLALKAEGTLWSWGYNGGGVLGLNQAGSPTSRTSPTQVPGNQWIRIASSRFVSHAIKSDGTLWGWGCNSFGCGNIGDGTTDSRSCPTQIPGNNWTQVSSNRYGAAALKGDGTLWSWGRGCPNWSIGDGTIIPKCSPVQIPGNNWTQLSVGYQNTFAIKSDGTLWGWGAASIGKLASGDQDVKSSPIQIPGNAWVSVLGSGDHVAARKSDGSLWGWGCNGNGQLGIGDTCNRSSPVQIPGNQWIDVKGKLRTVFGRKAV